jgi:hypothetical protein
MEHGEVKYLSKISKLEKQPLYGKCKKWLQILWETLVLINLLFSKITFQKSLINYLDGLKKKLEGMAMMRILSFSTKVFCLQLILDSGATWDILNRDKSMKQMKKKFVWKLSKELWGRKEKSKESFISLHSLIL